MRMRRKKHLTERLNAVDNLVIVRDKITCNLNDYIKDKQYLNFSTIFGNDNPVCLEIGCGKGGFVCEMAKLNPKVNFIAVELLENIVVLAAELIKSENLTNVRILNTPAECLPKYVKENSIQNIYLNFSPPYPQKGHENRRLSNERYCNIYASILIDDGAVFQKTDDKEFFEYSKQSFNDNGFVVYDVSNDLEKGFNGNVETEYEKKFKSLNMKIYGLKALKKTLS